MWPRIAVIGAGFGDEGKGRVVDYLCSRADNPLVIRFSGGHQAAHRVQLADGRAHVFAHFGSGTLRGAPTYWSHYCPVNPMAMLNEFGVLRHKDVKPRLHIDPRCPVTTPFEIAVNALRIERGGQGSCGVGIFETFWRERDGHHLLMEDVEFPEVFEKKVRQLRDFYNVEVPGQEINNFLWVMKNFFGPHGGGDPSFRECVTIVGRPEMIFGGYETLIFEGSQGLLLDQTYGFFPHVTPSNTGTKNILEMGVTDFQVVLVTRAYQTRHGDGPMARDITENLVRDNPCEENFNGGPQGKFRTTLLDLDMLRYGVMKDRYLRYHSPVLAITCLDIVRDDLRMHEGGKLVSYPDEGAFAKRLREALKAQFVIMSDSPSGDIIGGTNITPGWQ